MIYERRLSELVVESVTEITIGMWRGTGLGHGLHPIILPDTLSKLSLEWHGPVFSAQNGPHYPVSTHASL